MKIYVKTYYFVLRTGLLFHTADTINIIITVFIRVSLRIHPADNHLNFPGNISCQAHKSVFTGCQMISFSRTCSFLDPAVSFGQILYALAPSL